MSKRDQTVERSFAKTASVLFFITLFVKTFGLLREILMAAYIGMSQATDAYNIAILAANLITGVSGIAIGSSLIPILASISAEKGEEENEQFFCNVLWTLMVIAFVVAGVLYIFAVPMIRIMAPGFNDATVSLSADLFQMGFIKINAIVAATLFTQYLNYKNCFYSPMIAASIGTASVVLYFIIAGKSANVSALMTISVLSYLLQVIWMIPALIKRGLRIRPHWNLADLSLISFFLLGFPAILNYTVQQIGIVINRALASQLTEGSISALSYANSIVMMVNMTVSFSITTVIFPRLAEALSIKSQKRAMETLRQGILLSSILLFPAAVGLSVLSEPICSVLFERGIFTAENTYMTALALRGYSLGIVAYAYYEISNKYFNSMKNTKTPMMAAFVGVVSMIALSFMLFKPLKLLGLSFATSMMQVVMAIVLMVIINYKYEKVFDKELIGNIIIIILSTIIMGLTVFAIRNMDITSLLGGVLDLVIKIIIAIFVYSATLSLLVVGRRKSNIMLREE